MNEAVKNKIADLKKKYESEGFIILGIFGSYARGEEKKDSDIDILYETTAEFKNRYSGFEYFGRIYDIKEELKNEFHQEVDLASRNALNKIGRKYILPGVLYV